MKVNGAMGNRRIVGSVCAELAASITASYAGCACLPEIGRVQTHIEAMLVRNSRAPSCAASSTYANSIAITESQLGAVSLDDVKTLDAIIARGARSR
jgi:hypothetical protein